jgi:hypothetical protein
MHLLEPTMRKSVREAWSEYIAEQLDDHSERLPELERAEIVEALAHYCEELSRDSLLRAELIPQLFARAARPLRRSGGLDSDALPDPVRELLATGWLAPLSGEFLLPGSNWILDLRRLLSDPERTLEMAMLMVLKQSLERIAPLWDASHGRGLLALRGAQPVAARISSERAPAELLPEIRNHCQRVMVGIRIARNWERSPQVVLRDL